MVIFYFQNNSNKSAEKKLQTHSREIAGSHTIFFFSQNAMFFDPYISQNSSASYGNTWEANAIQRRHTIQDCTTVRRSFWKSRKFHHTQFSSKQHWIFFFFFGWNPMYLELWLQTNKQIKNKDGAYDNTYNFSKFSYSPAIYEADL